MSRKVQEPLLLDFNLSYIFANFTLVDLKFDIFIRVHVLKNCQATCAFQDEQDAYKLVFFPHLSVLALHDAFEPQIQVVETRHGEDVNNVQVALVTYDYDKTWESFNRAEIDSFWRIQKTHVWSDNATTIISVPESQDFVLVESAEPEFWRV